MSVKQLNLYNDKILSKLEQVIEVNKENKSFSIRFLQRSGTKYSFGENDDVGLVAPGPPDFYAWVIVCPSQWKMDHREHYSFFIIKCKFS